MQIHSCSQVVECTEGLEFYTCLTYTFKISSGLISRRDVQSTRERQKESEREKMYLSTVFHELVNKKLFAVDLCKASDYTIIIIKEMIFSCH